MLLQRVMSTAVRISSRDKFLFDLNGYIVVRNVLTPGEVSTANGAIDARSAHMKERGLEVRNAKSNTPLAAEHGRKDLGGILEWGADSNIFRSIVDHPKLIPYFHEFLGFGYRMDHLPFILAQDTGSEGFHLHGGSIDCSTGEYSPAVAYSCVQNRIYCPLLACSVALADVGEGDGGYVVVPGSHKANFPTPQSMIHGEDMWEHVQQPVLSAGDVILFSEGTVHGARPWTAQHQRRMALYRFSPATCAYGRSYTPSWPQKMVEGLTTMNSSGEPVFSPVLEPPYNLRADRPFIEQTVRETQEEESQGSEHPSHNNSMVPPVPRSEAKKSFDKQVFGTNYF